MHIEHPADHPCPIFCLETGHVLDDHYRVCASKHPGAPIGETQLARFKAIAKGVRYKDWEARIHSLDSGCYLKVHARLLDAVTGEPFDNCGPYYSLCEQMTDRFLVDLMFDAIKEIELHEVAEFFSFNDERVYYPHLASGQVIDRLQYLQCRKMPISAETASTHSVLTTS